MATSLKNDPLPDLDAFRLRRFVEQMIDEGEVEVVEEEIDLADVASRMDGNEKAVLFRKAGPEKAEIVGSMTGGRRRMAKAFGVEPGDLLVEVNRRLATPQEVIEIESGEAPVHEVILTGDDVDLTLLPVHLQHEMDGGPYISASLDYVVNPDTGWTNTGARRLMLRGKTETGIDLVAPSDLKAIYEKSAAKGEKLPVAFTVGAHPCDHVAAVMRLPVDELPLVASLRGAALPVVKCVTSDIRVPADAEYIIEGYLDERGHVEPEGPYGEFLGYYGVVKRNPVFHATAITHRKDPLFQTSTISGEHIGWTDTTQLNAIRAEVTVWRALQTAVREPVAVTISPRRRAAVSTSASPCASGCRARPAMRLPLSWVRSQIPSMFLLSIRISTYSTTPRWTGHWPPGFRPTATLSSNPGSGHCRLIPLFRAAGSAPRLGSI